MSSPHGLGQKASENILRFCFQVTGKKKKKDDIYFVALLHHVSPQIGSYLPLPPPLLPLVPSNRHALGQAHPLLRQEM